MKTQESIVTRRKISNATTSIHDEQVKYETDHSLHW